MMIRTLAAALTITTSVVALVAPAEAQTVRDYNIPAGSLKSALDAYVRASGRQIVYRADQVRAARSPGARGPLSADAALAALLAGSGFTTRVDGELVAIVQEQMSAEGAVEGRENTDIVVTGTNIRGAAPIAPTTVVTRKDIDRSGYSQVGDLMRSLPQNFAGGENPGNVGVGAANYNVANASTVNLRGLGTGTTLSLVNGHRLAGNASGQSSDISGIPLAAIARIEVVADGASAIYGSDAVGGVVNFILREDVNGAEFSATVGGATRGGAFEQTYSALGGISRSGWHALLNVEHSAQDGLTAAQRDFTASAPPMNTLLHPQDRTSAFFSGGLDISSRVSVNLEGLWNDRSGRESISYALNSTIYDIRTDTTNYMVNGGVDVDLSGGWTAKINASHASNHTDYRLQSTTTSHQRYENDTSSVEGIVTGAVSLLPWGDVQAALGGGWRTESYFFGPTSASGEGEHDIVYAFAEARIPFVSPSQDRVGLNELELNLSGRVEDYSDFGTSTTPKVGIRYVPFPALAVRATWGESFKAPTFQQMSQPGFALLYDASALAGTSGYALYVTGGSADLRPEQSTSWTVGADLTPNAIPTLQLGATYFEIDYRDRVVNPITAPPLALRGDTYAAYLIRNPSAEQQAALLDRVTFRNYTSVPYDPALNPTIVDNSFVNAAAQHVKGIDFSYRQEFALGETRLSAFANATWIRIDQQTQANGPFQRLSGTVANVPTFKTRGGLTWDVGNLSATAIVNYQDGSIDTGATPNAAIASLTTVDATLAYRLPSQGLQIALSATNLFDRDPPYAQSPGSFLAGITYDSVNASALGRIVRLSLRKAF